MKSISLKIAASLVAASFAFSVSANECSSGKTLADGMLTIATGNPAYYPWVIDDAPESGQGFEAAVAYAVADKLGYDKAHVTWVRTSFDGAIQPGAKNFDFNLQQFSILPERAEVVDFSVPYYTTTKAVVVTSATGKDKTPATLSGVKGLKFGAGAGLSAATFLENVVKPTASTLLYDDVANTVAALQANQVDAVIFDLPTALFVTAVQMDNGKILGQFPTDVNDSPDHFGMVFAKGNPLKSCVDTALTEMKSDGTLAAIEDKWLASGAGVPVIDMSK